MIRLYLCTFIISLETIFPSETPENLKAFWYYYTSNGRGYVRAGNLDNVLMKWGSFHELQMNDYLVLYYPTAKRDIVLHMYLVCIILFSCSYDPVRCRVYN